MQPTTPLSPRASLDDDWLAPLRGGEETTSPAPETPQETEPAKGTPRPNSRRRRLSRELASEGDDWLGAIDRSRDPACPTPEPADSPEVGSAARSTPKVTDRSDADIPDIFGDSPTSDPRVKARRFRPHRFVGRLIQAGRRLARLPLVGVGGLAAGLVLGIVFRSAPHTAPSEPAALIQSEDRPAAPVDHGLRDLVVATTGGDGVSKDLAEAIRAASPGQRIRVKSGIYRGPVVVDKSVEIIGDGKRSEVVIESDGGPALIVKADDALIRGLTVRVKPSASGAKGHAVEVAAARPVFENVDIEAASEAGLVLGAGADEPSFRRVVVRGVAKCGLVVVDKAGGLFENCRFLAGSTAGVAIAKEARAVLRGCEVHARDGVGLLVSGHARGTLIDCRLHEGGKAGAAVSDGARLQLLDTEVSGFTGPGVAVANDGEAALIRCHIRGNVGAGLVARANGRITLSGCDLAGNRAGTILAEPTCQVVGDADGRPLAPRPPAQSPAPPQQDAPTPPAVTSTNPVMTQPTMLPAIISPPLPPSRPAPPSAGPGSSGRLPEPAPDFDRYRNDPPASESPSRPKTPAS